MRKLLSWALLIASLSGVGMAANKESGSTTLKDVQPAGTTDKKHKKQQYDLTFTSSKNEYTCRTNEKDKVNAIDWVVGSPVSYKVNGNKGELKNTQSNKNVKCTVVRVAAAGAPATQ